MNVVVIGSGGRESALAWACRRYGHDVEIHAELPDDLHSARIDLVIIGPESALAAGAADRCAAAGVPCLGPTADLARLETSKGFCRELVEHLGIPSPRYVRTDAARVAHEWVAAQPFDVVVKADGLAAGKGVVVPEGAEATATAIDHLAASGPIVVEERLTGPECSLIVLCDGRIGRPLPIAQDHKRIGEADTGPNTGGMGAYAPAPVSFTAEELTATFVQPVIDHFAATGTPYVGVLFAGLMLTAEGPRLLEFNCRFGDPETQALMPLLDCDLAAVALACCTGTLADADLRIAPGSSCTVVAAAAGYPDDPLVGATVVDRGVDDDRSMVFPGALRDGRVAGGRVIAATGVGHTLAEARDAAYRRLERVNFNGMQVRGDIGWRAIGAGLHSYAAAGVDIEEGTRAVAEMKAAVEATHGPAVLGGVGSFGGSISLASLATMKEPVLVASTDGVGTKVELAARLGQRRGVGEDIVNHCINDVLVQGAVPLFFLDYIASSKLDATHVAEVVRGMADACSAAGCALLGGETAEMPGVYQPGSFDIAGTLVGVVDRPNLLPRPTIGVGDVLVGVESNGPHTNGYSFLRRLFEWLPMTATPDGFTMTLGETLLVPHRSYLPVLATAIDAGLVKGLAHITGGGLVENVPRLLPEGVGAQIRIGAWPLSPLWRLVRDAASGFDTDELYRTVNMGIGMVAVCAADTVADFQAAVAEQTWVIGELVRGERRVTLSR